eukprot:5039905-Amphidinium_carterae.1
MVLDFVDAFFQIPLNCEERHLFCTKLGDCIYIFRRLAQGSRLAPLIWARFAALVCRLCQSLFDVSEVRLQCYVDDPLATIRGDVPTVHRRIATLILAWRLLGLPLAFHKGQFGQQ